MTSSSTSRESRPAILIVHRFFAPAPEAQARILANIAASMSEADLAVDVWTGQTQPPAPRRERFGDVRVRRLRLPTWPKGLLGKAIDYVVFTTCIAVRLACTREKFDVVVHTSTPPIITGLAIGSVAKLRGSRVVYYSPDIHPEVDAALGGKQGIVHRAMRAIDRRSVGRADAVVVLSEDMRDVQVDRGGTNVHVIREVETTAVGADTSAPAVTQGLVEDTPISVAFIGNLGLFQGLGTVIGAAQQDATGSCLFHLVGDGTFMSSLIDQAGSLKDNTIFFHGRVSPPEALTFAASADVALITLNEGVIPYAFPAKLLTYLRAGTPIVATVDQASELARILSDNGVGFAVPPDRPDLLLEAIHQAAQLDPAEVTQACRALLDGEFSAARNLERWVALMEELA